MSILLNIGTSDHFYFVNNNTQKFQLLKVKKNFFKTSQYM